MISYLKKTKKATTKEMLKITRNDNPAMYEDLLSFILYPFVSVIANKINEYY